MVGFLGAHKQMGEKQILHRVAVLDNSLHKTVAFISVCILRYNLLLLWILWHKTEYLKPYYNNMEDR